MTPERCFKLEEKINQTIASTLEQLNACGRCAVIRPTGFGKTTLACRIARMPQYRSILYVYPSSEIRDNVKKQLKGEKKPIQLVSYMELALKSDHAVEIAKIVSRRYNLIIFDEFHHMGAEKASKTIDAILNTIDFRKTHVIGASATPFRMTGPDVIEKFFGNHMCFNYGADDAIRDGIMLPIHYVFAPRGYEKEFNKNMEAIRYNLRSGFITKDIARAQEIKLRKQRDIAVEILNVPNIIRDAMNIVYGEQYPSYISFIVFCFSLNAIKSKKKEIESWFSIAFGNNYRLKITVVSSYAEHREGRDYLKNMVPRPGVVDVIISMNLVNEGYHFKDLTGVLMLRPTKSNTIFAQQLGRCTSVNREVQPIAIDLIDNIHSKPLYNKTQSEFLEEVAVDSPTSVLTDVGKRLAAMSWIDPRRIVLVDKVAEVEAYTQRLDYTVSKEDEKRILNMRINEQKLVGNIAIRLGIPYWIVMRVIEKHKDLMLRNGTYFCTSDNREYKHTGKRPLSYKNAKVVETGRLLAGYYENLRQICSDMAAVI